ncbi:conserved oligomeric Golgi complex subunit 1 [Chlorella sorokiniana]|uniref:Conserved oligomeric Golgi complex subunit 1 n=1 Tax=Chlorella sorokiniana TaxID=3076 RepID=A0A2P6U465_CHLSO|nr:conserved oligomeric Golgi complex subunit 1 [Chlorella sorokiniana]|eukprot:PRW61105.1 conserved oligomeric Golgi complex subunit 1 [Chlorella sorokiniana]
MRFQLPATPSPAAVQLTLAACQEADRAGGHLLEDEALLLLKWQLGGAVLAALHAELATGEAGGVDSTAGQAAADADTTSLAGSGAREQQRLGDHLSEKGVLQLLFDVRFLLDLLAGGRPPSNAADAKAGAPAVAARRREGAQLESSLSDRLDPIDWATYEPYLYANKQRAAARSQVLFGLLLRGERAQAAAGAAATAGGMPAESNILRVAPVGPRFSYLPVSTPVALMRQSSQLLRAGSSAQAELGRLATATPLALSLGAAGSAVAGSEVSAAAYSFASLLSSNKARAGGEDGGAASSAAGGAGSASAAVGSGVASKLVGSLQGLLSDQLGDMGNSLSAPGGLLSSLASFRK